MAGGTVARHGQRRLVYVSIGSVGDATFCNGVDVMSSVCHCWKSGGSSAGDERRQREGRDLRDRRRGRVGEQVEQRLVRVDRVDRRRPSASVGHCVAGHVT